MLKKIISNCFLTFILALTISGCARTRPIVNVEGFIPEGMTKEQIKDAIIDGCEKVDWDWDTVDGDHIRASYLAKNYYQMVVDIDYSRPTKYEIVYLNSDNLNDNGKGEIHKAYYKWVGSLKKAIDNNLKRMSKRSRYCGKDSKNNLNSMCVLND